MLRNRFKKLFGILEDVSLPLVEDGLKGTLAQARFNTKARCELAALNQLLHCFLEFVQGY